MRIIWKKEIWSKTLFLLFKVCTFEFFSQWNLSERFWTGRIIAELGIFWVTQKTTIMQIIDYFITMKLTNSSADCNNHNLQRRCSDLSRFQSSTVSEKSLKFPALQIENVCCLIGVLLIERVWRMRNENNVAVGQEFRATQCHTGALSWWNNQLRFFHKSGCFRRIASFYPRKTSQ